MFFENQIPFIDLTSIDSDSEYEIQRIVTAIKEAYTKIGFAYLINHGIPANVTDNAFRAAKQFHSLPEETKLNIKLNKYFRGYMPLNSSTMHISTLDINNEKKNQSAAYIHLFEADTQHPSYLKTYLNGPNQWPTLKGFKHTITDYDVAMNHLAKKIVRLFALAFGMDRFSLDRYFSQPTTFLRLQYYPPQHDVIPDNQYGIAPHTDSSFVTLLAQDEIGGLQVRTCEGRWIDVVPIKDTLVLNSGYILNRLSNDQFISTPHRVINSSGKERFSIPYFYHPDLDAVIEPLDIFCRHEEPKYESMYYRDHLIQRLQTNYDIGATITEG